MVADIGGTNARLALARDRVVLTGSLRSYRNDAFDGFAALARHFLDQCGARDVTELVVAVAGPVWGDRAKLTNRDWSFEVSALSDALGITTVSLINDLSALGHALPALQASQIVPVYQPPVSVGPPTQSLIVGIGTGFNVSPVLHVGDAVHCLEAEFGHVSLPLGVVEAASPDLIDMHRRFPTVEECFSGRGYQSITDAGGTPALYAGLMGALARDLLLAFMPRSGLYFNGGVARSVLTSPACAEFVRVFAQPHDLSADLTAPVALINDDAAGLIGCARVTLPGR